MTGVEHVHAVGGGRVPPARWREAFPQGRAIEVDELSRMLQSHDLSHAVIWIDGADPAWPDHVAAFLARQPTLHLVLTSGMPDEQQGLQAIQTLDKS